MKQVTFTRLPDGGNLVVRMAPNEGVVLQVGETYIFPDEIAELVCAPKCPRCGAAYPPFKAGENTGRALPPASENNCPRCADEDMEWRGLVQPVPGPAEMVKR